MAKARKTAEVTVRLLHGGGRDDCDMAMRVGDNPDFEVSAREAFEEALAAALRSADG